LTQFLRKGDNECRIHWLRIQPVCKKSQSCEGINKATPVDKLQATPSGMPQAVPQATPQGMLGATPPVILISNLNFSSNLPQATPQAPRPKAILKNYLPFGHAYGNFKKLFAFRATPGATPPAILFKISKISNFSNNLPQATPQASPQAIFKKIIALRPRPKAILKTYLPFGHAYGNFKKLFAFRVSLRLRRGLRLRLYFLKFQKFPIFRTICPRLRPRRRLRQFLKK
ncbi:hypothetical protein T03_9069, partial [Trichinella britovi]